MAERKSGSFPLFGNNRKSNIKNRKPGFLRLLPHIVLILMLSAGLATAGHAGSGDEGSASGVFLKIDPGAQSAAMGSAFVAAPAGPYSMQFNPGVLGTADRQEVSLTKLDIFKGVSYNNIGYVQPMSEGYGALGFDLKMLDYGTQERRRIGSSPTSLNPITGLGNFSSDDLSLGIGWGKQFTTRLSSGFKVNYIQEQIAGFSDKSFSLNWGAHYRLWGDRLMMGTAVRNMVGDLQLNKRSDPLPRVYDAGLYYNRPFPGTGFELNSGLDYIYPSDADPYVSIGSELGWYKTLFLRAGFKGDAEAGDGFTFGGGFKLGDFTVDYAIVDFGELGRHQELSITYDFGSAPLTFDDHEEQSEKKKSSEDTEPVKKESQDTKIDTGAVQKKSADTETHEDTKPEAKKVQSGHEKSPSKGIKTRLTESGLEVTLEESVLFESGEASLKESAAPVLDELANLVEKKKRVRIEIAGHTDNVPIGRGGNFSSNWTLSAARSARVTRYLDEETPVQRNRLMVSAYGPYQPRVPNTSPENRSKNRRVDVELTNLSLTKNTNLYNEETTINLEALRNDSDVLPLDGDSSTVRIMIKEETIYNSKKQIKPVVLNSVVNWLEKKEDTIYLEVRRYQDKIVDTQAKGNIWEKPARQAAKVVDYLHERTGIPGKKFRVRIKGSSDTRTDFEIRGLPKSEAWEDSSSVEQKQAKKSIIKRLKKTLKAGKKAYLSEDYQQAVRIFEKALEINDRSDRALHWLAVSKAKVGQTQQAKKLLKKLLEESPDNSRARKNLRRLSQR